MADEIDAIQAIKKFSGMHQTRLKWWLAYAGDGQGNVYTSQQNYYIFRYPLEKSPPAEIFNNRINMIDNLRIIIGYTAYQPNLLQVLDVADQRLDGVSPTDDPISPGGVGYSTVPPHWVNHQYLGADYGLVNWRQLSSLGVFPTNPPSLSVVIWPGTIPRSGTDINVGYTTVDLTSHVPGSGARYALISFDSSGTPVVTDGTINAGGFAALTNADVPDTPTDNWRSCAVALYVGQTAIVENTSEIDFLDLRFPEEMPAGSITPGEITLANTHIIVGNASGVGADVAMSGDASIANTGALTIGSQAVTYAKLQNISAAQRVLGRNTAGAGSAEEVTASQELDWVGSTRGSILYRGASGWAILAPGDANTVLTSNGAGADPSYQSIISGAINVYNETQTADGSSTTYYLTNVAAPSTIRVYIDGIRQPASDDTDPTDTVIFSVAPTLGALLLFDYELSIT